MDINITVTEIIAESTISETVITCDVVMSIESDVDKAYVDAALALKVDKLENYSLVPDTEIDKLAGIEENANNYTHPDTHPSSILDVVDVVNGDANKFLNERGEMVAVATSSIGVTGSQLYASTANSDVAGYKSLVGTPQTLETEIILTAKSSEGIVWGDKYLSAPFTEAVTIPTTAYGFDYWRKVSAANGTSRKHLRVFLYRAGVETNISTPLASPDIDETEFTERQISYIFPELELLAGDRIGIQEGFSTTHANNITLTYIVGDGRGWFMRLPLPLKHESLTDKNSEAAVQHVDTTTTKTTLDAADMVAIKDSVTGKVVLTPKSNLGGDNLVAEYTYNENKEVTVTSVDLATGTFTKIAHGLINGWIISPIPEFSAMDKAGLYYFPTGLLGRYYYVVNATADTFQISTAIGGAAVTFTANVNADLSKWHFERAIGLSYLDFTNIPETYKAKVKIHGRGGLYGLYPIVSPIANTAIYWGVGNSGLSSLTTGFYEYSLSFDCEVEIDFSLDYSMFYSTFVVETLTQSQNKGTVYEKRHIAPNKSPVKFTTIRISPVWILNGTNIKIYA